MNDNKMLLVNSDVLPDVFSRVVAAKELLASGEVTSSSEAARRTGISRSAFYKYKDSVFPFNSRSQGKIVTIHSVLRDKAGALSLLLGELYAKGANILTVNQGIPSSGVASVSISFRTEMMTTGVDELIEILKSNKEIVSIKQISGE